LPAADIINLHWIAGFVDLQSFFSEMSRHVPIVWTLHDMNAFTGGCHYDEGCGKYELSCGACPQLSSSKSGDRSHRIWLRKRDAFAEVAPGRLQFVSPSRWLADALRRSSLLADRPVTVIPNGVDVDDFAPRDRRLARDALGIPSDAAVVLFVADSVENRRKGFTLLAEALADLHEVPNLLAVSVGRDKPTANFNAKHLHLGYVDNDRFLSLIYSAADAFAIPSLQDNLPNTVLESLACGTPVVGFDLGGIPDLLRPGVTGFLAPEGDVAAFRDALASLLQDPALRVELAANCRHVAVTEYSLEVQARRYLELYESVLAEDTG
jgi:glycosyltransferase involved in cell wall biosynthesis